MRFFDTKEEVIDIQLTKHGKELLSEGKLKPVYYAFFDHDVVYDASYENREEEQNNAEGRIKNSTPRLKTQCNFVSPETLGRSNMTDRWRRKMEELHYGMPMGRSALDSEYAPAWSVDYLYGELTGSTTYLTASGGTALTSSILQLDSTVKLTSYVTRVNPDGSLTKNYVPAELEDVAHMFGFEYEKAGTADEGSGDLTPEEYESMKRPNQAADDTILQVKPDYLLLEIAENNVDFIKDNFEIEVFETRTETNDAGHPWVVITKQLEFFDFSNLNATLTPDHVEYYFDINIDNDIPSELFCASSVVAEKRKDMLVDDPYPKNCPDFADPKNLYVADVDYVEEPC